MIACNSPKEIKEAANKLKGDWAFLDKYGIYNEAFFGDSMFFIYNKENGKMPGFKYAIKNDSLLSNFRKNKNSLERIARIQWLSNDKIILSTEFVSDTLDRIPVNGEIIDTTNILLDTGSFVEAHKKRHEDFLVKKGILSPEDVKEFKESGEVPDYLKRN